MGRSLRSAKTQGTRFETAVARYMAGFLQDPRIERRARNGGKDRGDIAGLEVKGHRIVVECKDHGGRQNTSEWLKEAETECKNDRALACCVVSKRRGIGLESMQNQLVSLTLRDFLTIVGVSDSSCRYLQDKDGWECDECGARSEWYEGWAHCPDCGYKITEWEGSD